MVKIKKDLFASVRNEGKSHSRVRLLVLGILLLAAAVLVVWLYLLPEEAENTGGESTLAPSATLIPTPAPETLSARQTREAAYEKDLQKLKDLSQDETIKEETRQQAARQMTRMIQQHQMELGLEEALTSAGFVPCLVLMQNDALTVAVSAPELSATQSAVILSICLAHTDVASENIRIMPGGI